ncbi:MAG: FdhF/YdeP family oxidoreductase [Opitutaceae bacterium]
MSVDTGNSVPVRLGRPPRAAAGLGAVLQTLKHVWLRARPSRATRALLRINQRDGFDCQSCAWPNPDGKRHALEFCENGAKALASELSAKKIGRDFFARHAVRDLERRSDHWLELQGRLTEPMALRPGATHYTPMAWDEAFDLAGSRLRALPSADAAAFYTSGRASNEAAFVYQLFARIFGTNNLPDCSNLCHESSGSALGEALGAGKGTVTLEDLEAADLIVIMGQNPGTNHPRMLTSLEHAKRRGARIIAVNPLREPGLVRVRNPNPQEYSNPLRFAANMAGLDDGTPLADLFLQVRLNGDLPLLKALCRAVLDEEEVRPGQVLDRAFIDGFTRGFDAFADDLRAGDIGAWALQAGVAEGQIREAARLIAGSRRLIVCWAMGLTQHRNAVDTIRYILNLLFLGGNMGRPGAGACPVRGHSNVQGDRTVGIWERPKPEFLDALGREFGFEPPREPGRNAVETITAMREGRIRAFVSLGGNLLQAASDTDFATEAFRRCELTVMISTKLNRAHLVTGQTALILPCLGRSETDIQTSGPQRVSVEDSMSVISPSIGWFRPVDPRLRSEVAIVCGLARATVGERVVRWDELAGDYGRIRERIGRVVPALHDYNQRLKSGPFTLDNGPRGRRFATRAGKALFHTAPVEPIAVGPGEFLLQTIRSHDQFNTTIYGLDDRYRGVFGGRRVVFLNPEDIAAQGWQQGVFLDLSSHYEGVERRARRFMVAPYDIPRGCAAAYFPEANVLVPNGSVAAVSGQPTSKSVVVRMRPSVDQAAAAREHADGYR